MKLGRYDQKIEFITEGNVPDGAGGYVPTIDVVLATWARIEQLPTSKNIEQAQMQLPSIFRLGVQARKGFTITTAHSVRWRNEIYQIISSPTVADVRLRKEWIFDIKRK